MTVVVEPLPPDTRVGVVDDNADDSYTTSLVLRQAGYIPVEISPSESLDRLVELLATKCQAAVCDHRLNAKTKVRFTGAELVYRITLDYRIPAVLNTTWASVDQDTSIRRWRSGIPSLLDKSDQTSATLTDALALAAAEARGETPRDRVA
jgi:CheY-like chemotaxis protein